MRTRFPLRAALASVAALALSAAALAGEAVRLAVEPPKNTTSVEAGDPGIDVQIVGIDANDVRVGFSDRKVETSANEGELVLVEAPYKYRYIPPATVGAATPVTLRAWLKQAPDVKGEAALTVMPRRPYERLTIVAPATSVELGRSIEVTVRGVRGDGTAVAIKGHRVTLAAEGGGRVDEIDPATFRYTAPAKGDGKLAGATIHLSARLEGYPAVAGELSIVLTAEAPPPPTGGEPTKPTPPKPQPPVEKPPKPEPAPGDDEGGVLWPSGNVRLLVWRTKRTKVEEFPTKEREDIAGPGKPLLARGGFHRLRVQIEREDVRKVELEWYVGEKKGAPIHVDDADKDGRLRLEKNKAGKTCAILECETPDEKPLFMNLLLTTNDGKILTEEFVLQRGRDKDDDGDKDGKRKKK